MLRKFISINGFYLNMPTIVLEFEKIEDIEKKLDGLKGKYYKFNHIRGNHGHFNSKFRETMCENDLFRN